MGNGPRLRRLLGSGAALLVAALALPACGGHLHRAGDAALSEAALASNDALDFEAGFRERDEAEGALLDRELSAARAQIDADRDAALIAILEDYGGRAAWSARLGERLSELTGEGMDADMAAFIERFGQGGKDLGDFQAAFRELERARDSYLARAVALDLDVQRAPPLECPGLDDPARSPELDGEFAAFTEACDAMGQLFARLGQGEGALGTLSARLAALHRSMDARAERGREPLSAYVNARANCRAIDDEDFVAVARCLKAELPNSLMRLEDTPALEAEQAAFVGLDLDSLGEGPGDPLRLRLLDEQVQAVERVLEYEASGRFTADGDPLDKPKEIERSEELDEVALALAVSGTRATVKLDGKPRRYGVRGSELALVLELLSIERDGTKTIHRLAMHRLDLDYMRVEAMLRERQALLAAQTFLLDPGCAAMSVEDALVAEPGSEGAAGQCASYLRASLIEFAKAWTVGKARARESEVRSDALHEHEMRVRSTMALATRGIWMAAAIAELHRYNASGLRPETLATVVTNLAGFAVVAAGVFR